MAHINGIGGAFVFSHRPQALAEWYTEHLGLQFEGGSDAFYQIFWSRDDNDHAVRRDTSFSIIKANEPMTRPVPDEEPESMYGDQPFMVNFRTDDLDALTAHLQGKGVSILQYSDEGYARFAWIRDLDGHRIELYQPVALPA